MKNNFFKSETPIWLVAVFMTSIVLAFVYVIQSINEEQWLVVLLALGLYGVNLLAAGMTKKDKKTN